MSKICYSTSISSTITEAWVHWQSFQRKGDKLTMEYQNKKNAAFCAFVRACERENKYYKAVDEKLFNQF